MNEPSRDKASLALSIMRHTGTDGYFGWLVDGTLRKLRAAMAAPKPGVDERVDAEFEALRSQLGKFHGEYQQAYAELMLEHLDPDVLPEIAMLVESKAMLAYFAATAQMGEKLPGLFEELSSRMLHHARYRAAG